MNIHYIKQILTIVLLSLLSLSASAREVVIPEGTKIVDSDSGYRGDTTITSIVIPNSVTEIGWHAFSGCTSLTSVEIPSSVTEIGGYAFAGCTGLTSVEIPSSVTSIEHGAFSGCSGLTSVEIPNSVTEIVWLAFEGCSGLTSIKIPSSVTEIGKGAFIDCENLSKVICYAVTPPSAHADFCEHGTLYVPAQSVEAYKNDRSWGQFDTILPISDDAPVSITQTLTICDNELPIKWNGHWVKGDTTLALGADTVVDLRLYVNHSMETILYDTVLCGSSYQDWGWSMKEPQSGTYVDTFTTATGCDSIVTLHLYVMGGELVIPEGTKTISYKDGYHGNKCITSVKIPNSVTEIGEDAFYGCKGLTSVEIPNSVTVIEFRAFSRCTGLTSVEIPNSVTVIESRAFSDCTGLTSIVIPNSVTSIGYEVFSGCTGLKSVVISNPVTEIGQGAFEGCTGLTSVEIPNSVTEIGWYAFSGCTSLTSVEIPSSVTEIGGYAFSGCTGLTGVEIPNSVTVIESRAFSRCTGLTSIVIPNSVTSIGYEVFSGCTGLKSVVISNSVTEIRDSTFADCYNLTNVVIPNSVTKIGEFAFSGCTGLKSVEIPNSVTSIDYGAFYGCTNLSRVVCYAVEPPAYDSHYSLFSKETLSDTLYVPAKSLSAYKQDGDWGQFKTILPIEETEVPTVTIDETIRVCEHDLPIMWRGHEIYGDTVLAFNDTLWYMNLSLQRPVVIEKYDTVFCGASYKDYGFAIKDPVSGIYTDSLSTAAGCDSIVVLHLEVNGELVIPEGTKEITYEDGYHGNKCITSVKIPNSVTEIGPDAFLGCTGLTSIEIPNSVEYVGRGAFAGCVGLTSIVIPNSVSMIGYEAFYGCVGLTSVVIPNSVTKIDSFVFDGCTGLTSVKIPNSVEYVERGAFAGCVGLTSVELPNSVMMIGQEAFSHCISLTSVEIPNSVTEIGRYAFYGCTGLTSVEIPNSVTEIGRCAFYGCTGLTSVEIPNSVTEIGTYAFSGCTSLSKVVCYAVEPPACYSSYYYHVFSDETLKGTLYVPAKSLSAYKQDVDWGQFKTILPIEGSELPTVTIDEIIPVCENDLPINWRNHWIDGDTILTISSKSGVDTLFHISLEIHSTFGVTDTLRLEQGERYEWFHWVITEAGLYTDTALTAMGCDSIVSLYVYYKEPTDTIPTEEVDTLYCQGTMAEWCANPVVSASLKAVVIEGQIYDKNTKSLVLPEGVATIHGKAFALCPNIRTLVLPSTLVAISDSAFKSCISLASVTCYAPEPPVAMASTFGNYNGYLYIPCDYQSDYDIHVCWGTFKHVDCIAAESTVVEDVEVDPSYDSADISWPKVEDVKGYSIEIYLNGKVLLSLRFNANGQLERIDFSLGNGSVNPAPASMGSLTTLKSAIEGFRFSVSGLEEATTYRYTLKVLGDMDKVIETHSGKFTTLEKPSDGVEDIDSSKDDFIVFAQNGLISVVSEEAAPVLIYNLQGQCLFSHQGSCTFRAPCAGVYVVRCGERTVKLILNYEL